MIRLAAGFALLALVSCGDVMDPMGAKQRDEEARETARREAAAYQAEQDRLAAEAAAAAGEAEEADVADDPVPTAEDLIPWERLDQPTTAELTVDWTDAKDHVGEFIAVEGTVVDTHNSGRACFLNFTTEWRGTFYLAILGSNMDDYPESPERYFLNKKVRAVGKVAMYRDRPQIVIESPQHITLLDE